MKKLGIAALLTAVIAHGAFGMVARFERPILRAKLVELGNDDVIGLKRSTLTLNQRELLGMPTSFTFEERVPVVYITHAECPPTFLTTRKNFSITGVEVDHCGSLHYIAMESRDRRQGSLPTIMTPPAKLEVVSHQTRLCDDNRKYMWDVELTNFYGDGAETRSFGGNPRPVVSIR